MEPTRSALDAVGFLDSKTKKYKQPIVFKGKNRLARCLLHVIRSSFLPTAMNHRLSRFLRHASTAVTLGLASTLTLFSSAASAVPVLVNSLVATGPITAIYIAKDAADTSSLWLNGVELFNNTITPVGKVFNAGAAGPAVFELRNESMLYSFFTGIADSVDGKYYAGYSYNYEDFGMGALPVQAKDAIDLAGGGFLFIGFEDRRGGDFDFNDLIFAFKPVELQQVPEPGTLALLGLGLLGVACGPLRRRRHNTH